MHQGAACRLPAQPASGTVEIEYLKRRARGSEWKRLGFRDGASSTAGGLIRTLIELTAAARRQKSSDSLWVYFHVGRLHDRIPRYSEELIESWIVRHGIVDDNGHPLRLLLSRLRKTHKALWYAKTQGDLTRFAIGHTPEVAARHYADLPSLRHLHEQAIADGLNDALVSALQPRIVMPREEARARKDPAALRLPIPIAKVRSLMSGKEEVWLASCSGFHRSPFAQEGEPCPQPFWGCLECRNAVITARKLPALIAFVDFMVRRRAEMAENDWKAKFGRAFTRITQQILPAFPELVVAEARQKAKAPEHMPYLPAGGAHMKPTSALKLVRPIAPHPLAGMPVLESAPLRPGYKRSALSRFEDSTWDLAPAVFRTNARICHITAHFDGIADPGVERTLREFLYARLNFDVAGHRCRITPSTLRQLFNRTRCFLEFLAFRQGTCNLSTVDQDLLDAYRDHLRADPQRSATRVAHLLEVVVDLHHYRDHMPSGGLDVLPWKGRSAFFVAGAPQTSGENRTPRLPEAVISPLLTWSLKYITVFAADILAARAELEALQARHQALFKEDHRLSEDARRQRRRARLVAYLDERRAQGRGVPIWTTVHNGVIRKDAVTGAVTPPINAHLIHRHVGIDAQSEPAEHVLLRTKRLVLDTISSIGVEAGGMDTPITIDPETGSPWRSRFDAKALLVEERMLQAACYIVCAYLSGMRDCEVQAMRSGCLEITRSEDGLIERYRIKSTIFKRRDVRGQSASWITIEPVAKAIAVLERLTAHIRQRSRGDTLWRVLKEREGGKAHISAEIVRQLNDFRDYLNDQFGTPDTPVVPPGPNGKPWRITTRQFRRTVAWHIANRPFGTVAGMIQYKHIGIASYEGYAGSSRSGFRNEVERERALGQLDDVLAYFERHRAGEVLTGPAATRITAELRRAAEEIEPFPGHVADAARVRVMLGHVARTLFVGVLNDCFFDPATALCLSANADRSAPAMAQCRPDRCPNSCITSRHRPMWSRAVEDVCGLLSQKRLPAPQRLALEQELVRLKAVLRQARPASGGHGMAESERAARDA